MIKCNRQDSIDRVVRELLTPDEGVTEHFDGVMRVEPMTLLPRRGVEVIDEVALHFITGSERERKDNNETGDYVDGCANHFLLANAYSALAEGEGLASVVPPFAYQPVPISRAQVRDRNLNKRRIG